MGNFFYRLLDMLLYPLRMLFYAPARLFASGKRVFGLSVPARIAWLVALLLLLCAIISFVAFAYSTGHAFLMSKFRAVYLLTILVLLVVIPVIVYHVLRLWLEGDVSPFTDIDKAWNAGIAELRRQGIDLQQTPLFLIVGSPDEAQNKALFDATRISLAFRDLPAGPAALHWFANAEAIYIALTRVGCLGRLTALGKSTAEVERARVGESSPPPGPAARRPLSQTMMDASEPSPRDSSPGGLGTSMNLSGGAAPRQPGAPQNISGTIMPSEDSIEAIRHGAMGEAASRAQKATVVLPADEAVEQDRRLEYFSQLLSRNRRPICPANGILTLLPYGLIERGDREAAGIQQAISRDLTTLSDTLQLRCPTTAMVVGMESDSGFRELVRRVGRDRSGLNRFGKGFAVNNPPIPERLAALCAHACGAFEDWVYALFRERGALNKPGNPKLYALLARVRQHVQPRLENILVAAYGDDPDHPREAEPFYFSGCYFAAVGESDDRQAFTKSVLEKLPQEQAELQWTTPAMQTDRRYQSIAQGIFVVDFLLLALIVAMLLYHFVLK